MIHPDDSARPRRAIVYLRATDAARADSLDRQRLTITRYAEAHGLALTDECVETR